MIAESLVADSSRSEFEVSRLIRLAARSARWRGRIQSVPGEKMKIEDRIEREPVLGMKIGSTNSGTPRATYINQFSFIYKMLTRTLLNSSERLRLKVEMPLYWNFEYECVSRADKPDSWKARQSLER